jgi:hypothetical protein
MRSASGSARCRSLSRRCSDTSRQARGPVSEHDSPLRREITSQLGQKTVSRAGILAKSGRSKRNSAVSLTCKDDRHDEYDQGRR